MVQQCGQESDHTAAMEVPESADVRREPFRRLLAQLAAGMESQTGEPFSLTRDPEQAELIAAMFELHEVDTSYADGLVEQSRRSDAAWEHPGWRG
jgi:hypothetical protein